MLKILEPIYTRTAEVRAIYAPRGADPGEGDVFRFPDLAAALERLAGEGPGPSTRESSASRWRTSCASAGACSRARTWPPTGRSSAQPVARLLPRDRGPHQSAPFLGRDPDRLRAGAAGAAGDERLEDVVAVMGAANDSRGREFGEGLRRTASPSASSTRPASTRSPRGCAPPGRAEGRALGSTTHLVGDRRRRASAPASPARTAPARASSSRAPGSTSTTCSARRTSTRAASTVTPAGERMPSMMSPTVILRDGEVIAGLGSAGSNRIRSAILQTIDPRSSTTAWAPRRRSSPRDPLRGRHPAGGARHRRGGAGAARGGRAGGCPLARAQPLLRRRAGGCPRPRPVAG